MNNNFRKDFIYIDEIKICYYYSVNGNGNDIILLLHGAGLDSALLSWGEVMPLLTDEFNVIALDLPGYGDSGKTDKEYSLAFYTEIVKEFIIKMNLNKVILCGLSLGGGITLNLAIHSPSLLKAIVPVDAWGLFQKLPFHQLTYYFINSSLNYGTYKISIMFPFLMKHSIVTSLFGDKSKVTNELLSKILLASKDKHSYKPFISFQRSEILRNGFKTDIYSMINQINIPTLLIHGELDKAVPLEGAIRANKEIKNSYLYIMKACKHWPQKERPHEFTKAIKYFKNYQIVHDKSE